MNALADAATGTPNGTPKHDETPFHRLLHSWSVPLHLLLGGLVVLAMVVLASLLIWEGWHASRSALRTAARDAAHDIGVTVEEKVRRMLEPSQAMLSLLTLDPVTQATTIDDRLRRLRGMIQVINQSPLISAAYVGYPDGEFFSTRAITNVTVGARFDAPPQAQYLVQSVTLDDPHWPLGRWNFFYTGGMRPLGTQLRPDYVFDPRQRPWYQQAAHTDQPQLTEPYVFFSTGEVGITLSQQARTGGAVVGLDVTLVDLSRELATLRHTPRTEIAVVDNTSHVVAYTGSSTISLDSGQEQLPSLNALPVLANLQTQRGAAAGSEVSYMEGGELWHGTDMPLELMPGSSLRILIAIPDTDLLGPIREVLTRQGWSALILVLALLPLGWLAGRQISRELDHLSQDAQQLTRFDFVTQDKRPRTFVREVKYMLGVFGNMRQTIQNFLLTTHMISRESEMDKMLQGVLERLVESTRCTAGAVYLMDTKDNDLDLHASYSSPDETPLELPPSLAIEALDGMDTPDRLALKLTGRQGDVLGLLLLNHNSDDLHRSEDFRAFAVNLSGSMAVAIETLNLIESQERLFHSVVRLLADAIDAKSPYTGGHCERVPKIADLLIDRLCGEGEGPFSGFQMSAVERYEFRVGAWLHDCGKITSPEYIVDKATKLETIYNRIHEIRTRFEVLWRDAVIEHKDRLLGGEDEQASLAVLEARQRQLREDFAFVAASNVGGEFMTKEAMDRLRLIGGQSWLRHFDDRLGLSQSEISRNHGTPPAELPAQEALLADRPDHIVPWERRPPVERGDPHNKWGFDMVLPANSQNLGELYNLGIQRGTLTDEDRFKINDHIVQTYIMLRALPWPKHLARVPEIAATHHERLDGRGYPRKLGSERLTVSDRVMALSDVFEALTATDRPYSAPKKMSLVLRIMAKMASENHLDADLFRYFVKSRLWEDFGKQYMRPEQLDAIDDAMIESLLNQST